MGQLAAGGGVEASDGCITPTNGQATELLMAGEANQAAVDLIVPLTPPISPLKVDVGLLGSAERRQDTSCALIKRSFQSLYLVANITYVLYALLIISIHFKSPDSSSSSSSSSGSSASAEAAYAEINKRYRVAAIVHLLNAVMYVWVWVADGYGLLCWLQVPEYLNIAEAGLYLWSARLYGRSAAEGFVGPYTDKVQTIELAASWLELGAAAGWATTWYLTYPRERGRGFYLEDPDLWAAPTIVLAAIMYVVYNVQIAVHPDAYGADELYFYADLVYVGNAFLYLAAAMRDVGWFNGCLCGRSFALPVCCGPWPEVAPYDAKAAERVQALYEATPWVSERMYSGSPDSTSSSESLPEGAAVADCSQQSDGELRLKGGEVREAEV